MDKSLFLEQIASIDFGKGSLQENEKLEDTCNNIVLSSIWPSGVSLKVLTFDEKQYSIYISKSDTVFETIWCRSSSVLSNIQKIAKNIDDGEYSNKKTDKEKVKKIIEDRNRTSYMNDTKWNTFLDIVNNRLPFSPAFTYKSLFDLSDKDCLRPINGIPNYFGDYSYEAFEYKHYLIEWIRITPKYCINKGGCLISKIEVQDETEELIIELKREHIPYEIEESDVIIYGYR